MDQSFVAGFAAGAGFVNLIYVVLLHVAKRLGVIGVPAGR